jgi:hypothetical protein
MEFSFQPNQTRACKAVGCWQGRGASGIGMDARTRRNDDGPDFVDRWGNGRGWDCVGGCFYLRRPLWSDIRDARRYRRALARQGMRRLTASWTVFGPVVEGRTFHVAFTASSSAAKFVLVAAVLGQLQKEFSWPVRRAGPFVGCCLANLCLPLSFGSDHICLLGPSILTRSAPGRGRFERRPRRGKKGRPGYKLTAAEIEREVIRARTGESREPARRAAVNVHPGAKSYPPSSASMAAISASHTSRPSTKARPLYHHMARRRLVLVI